MLLGGSCGSISVWPFRLRILQVDALVASWEESLGESLALSFARCCRRYLYVYMLCNHHHNIGVCDPPPSGSRPKYS